MIRVGDVFRSLTNRPNETWIAEEPSPKAGYVKMVVKQGEKELRTRKSVHVTELQAKAHFGYRLTRGTGERLN